MAKHGGVGWCVVPCLVLQKGGGGAFVKFSLQKKLMTVKTNRKYPAVCDLLDACLNDIVTEGAGKYYSGGPEGGVGSDVVEVILG